MKPQKCFKLWVDPAFDVNTVYKIGGWLNNYIKTQVKYGCKEILVGHLHGLQGCHLILSCHLCVSLTSKSDNATGMS